MEVYMLLKKSADLSSTRVGESAERESLSHNDIDWWFSRLDIQPFHRPQKKLLVCEIPEWILVLLECESYV